jgi:nanoRNase/pAp phosphatase (c-di-AMP/oligoRNAs hydrolase)
MLAFVDRVDSGDLTVEEIQNPKGWVLLGFIMDPRTGLGRFRNFTISNYDLMKTLTKACREKSIDEILELSDVRERIDVYNEQTKAFKVMVQNHVRTERNAIVADLRGVETINAGNRFIIYTLFPEQNISVWIVDGKDKQNVAITVGYSIINQSATVNIGSLLLQYGGGGHVKVGSCQAAYDDADRVIREIIDKVT